jgi:hypothetical protein
VQDPQVLLRRPLRMTLAQHVVSQPEAARREQVPAIAIVRKGPRLAHQPVDDVAVLDAVLAPPTQARQRLHPPLGVPHLDPLRVQPGLHPLADQPARHRVGVAPDVNRAARVHPQHQPTARLQPAVRQRTQQRQLLLQPPPPAGVELLEQPTQERLVLAAAGEVAAAPQQEGLVQRPLELPVALLHVPVLVGVRRLDRLAGEAVVPQQRLVASRERRRPLRPRRDRRRQPVGAVQLWRAAQLPQGVLQALGETLVALREADRARLPVRVGQHEVVNQVVERRPGDGHAQVAAVREVAGAEPSGVVDLGKEHFLGRPLQGAPLLDAPLQGPQLAVGEASGEAALQVGEQGLGLQAGVDPKQGFELRPDLGEGVGPRAVVAFHASHLAGQLAEPAVLARRLLVHAGPGRRLTSRQSPRVQAAQAAHLLIGKHLKPPCQERLQTAYAALLAGNSSCR